MKTLCDVTLVIGLCIVYAFFWIGEKISEIDLHHEK